MLQVTSVELYKESRKISIGDDNISQVMKFGLYGNFDEVAGSTGDIWVMNDDHWVVKFIYDNFPWFREFPTSTGGYSYLFLTAGEIEQMNDNLWVVTLTYDIPDTGNSGSNQDAMNTLVQDFNLGPDAGENNGEGWSDEYTQLSFNATSQLGHINTSLKVVEVNKTTEDFLPAGVGVPNIINKPGAIGASENGIEGTDIYKREFTFQITKYFSPQELKYAYVRRLYRLAGTVNLNTFFGFPQGSVLFIGASGSGTLMQNVPVTFEFAVRPNFVFSPSTTQLSDPENDDTAYMYDILADPGFDFSTGGMEIGPPGILSSNPLPVHSGWAVVDYRYIPLPDTTAKMLVQRPAFRIIHQVYEFGDFSKLKVGK